MHMIGHEDICMYGTLIAVCRVLQSFIVELIVFVGKEYRLPIVTTLDEMQCLSWHYVSRSTCHSAVLCVGKLKA